MMLSGKLFSRSPISNTKLLNGTVTSFSGAHSFQITVTCVVGREKNREAVGVSNSFDIHFYTNP